MDLEVGDGKGVSFLLEASEGGLETGVGSLGVGSQLVALDVKGVKGSLFSRKLLLEGVDLSLDVVNVLADGVGLVDQVSKSVLEGSNVSVNGDDNIGSSGFLVLEVSELLLSISEVVVDSATGRASSLLGGNL